MALNDNYNIGQLPSINLSRSKFDKSHGHLMTGNCSELLPIFIDELLPGTTINIKTSFLARLQTLLFPIYGNLYLDTYFFFCPSRLVWDHFEEFIANYNKNGHWYPDVQYQIPTVLSEDGFPVGSIADHLGIPINCENTEVNALPLRMIPLVWNEYFRDENLSDPVLIPMGDDQVVATDTDNYINDGAKGLSPLKVAKYRDVFTTCLPSPQKGPVVNIPNTLTGNAIVAPNSLVEGLPEVGFNTSMKWNKGDGLSFTPLMVGPTDAKSYLNNNSAIKTNTAGEPIYPTNLVAYLGSRPVYSEGHDDIPTGSAVININQLRLALSTQRLLEADSRFGSRYIESLLGHFGVTSPDARLQRPEFLGGSHNVLNIDQVVQTSETGSTPLGDTGAYSVTAGSNENGDVVNYSSVEHGYCIGFACVRYEHVYQQGLDKMWSRRNRLDFYWPELSNIGEVGVKQKEICMLPFDEVNDPDGADEMDNREKVFGYQEAWYDYRVKKNYVSGEMHSGIDNTLDYKHLADYYESHPVLGDTWIREDGSIVDRTIAVSERLAQQIEVDFWFDYDYVAPIPTYSIPSIVDMR